MRQTWLMFVLVLGALGACKATGETIPPIRPLGPGVPLDLPALGEDDFAIVRLVING